AFALTEPEAGSDPKSMRTAFRRDGDRFLLNGEKYLISNGGISGLVVTFAYPESAEEPRRITAFLAETGGPGVRAEELAPRVGNVPCGTAHLFFRDQPAHRLGREGDGLRIAMAALVGGRLSVAAGCLGVIEDCLAEAVAYARARHQHGKPIALHQLVQ